MDERCPRQGDGLSRISGKEVGGFGTWFRRRCSHPEGSRSLALKAGVDLDITYEPAYMGPLIENVQEGRVPTALVDRRRPPGFGIEISPRSLRKPLH